ncbi:transposase [Rhizobium sp. WYCCWR10014]|uniref:Mu transposase C-terminal domain-containing protein n=1 Tax=Rhizobium TaxID=379 RepID=UPI0007E417B3|nr:MULTISPECIES: Mu transposase C-terminal domain-containing protein [Rhizobium]OAV50578.1 transposase [Rhizobium sp. WYCCWR10014]QIO70326.1 DDE-type integrase/transposase/recombinase [Rhizobium leguminosarum bv. trifolii]
MAQTPDRMLISETAWQKALAREAVIRPIAFIKNLTGPERFAACRELGLKPTRFYQLLAQFRRKPVTSSLLDETPGPEKGRRLLSREQEDAVAFAIEETYCRRERPTVTAVHDHVRLVCRERNLPAPSWKAVKVRIDQVDRQKLTKIREGAPAARQRFTAVVGEYSAQHAMEIVQIDHTLVDLFVVDAVNRQPLQRPWLTLAIDIASRMVAGFYLSLEHPSSTSVALAIQHMVLPKTPWLAERNVIGDWPVYGLPTAIHLDNAREFRGRALAWGVAEHGINLIHRPVARPHYGGHIERLIGTMMGAVHFLPGSTSGDIASRGDYDPQKHAVMTFDELERWLALEIVGRYHVAIHRALKTPPRLAWEDAVLARHERLRLPYDEHRFVLDFLPFEERAIRRDGLHLFGLKYWDDVLSPWTGAPEKMRVRYDPRDISCVFVDRPNGESWPVRFANLGRPRITLGEHQQAVAALRARGLLSVDESLIFETIIAQRQIVEMAGRQTRSMRRGVERQARALAATERHTIGTTDDDDESEYLDLSPLSVEEWS